MRSAHSFLAATFSALVLSVVASPAEAAPKGWMTDVEAAFAEAQKSQRNVLVDLYADWCGWCLVLEDKVFATAEFKEYARNYVLLYVDVEDGGQGTDLQARYGATSLPTTLILSPKRIKIGEVQGFVPTRQFIGRVEGQLRKYATSLKYYEQASRSTDMGVLQNLAEDLHGRGDGGRAAVIYERVREHVPTGSQGAAWLHYMLADAYRLDGAMANARDNLNKARGLADEHEIAELAERIGLLAYHIAHDVGDCQEAAGSLEEFLRQHPRSGHARRAQRALSAMKNGTDSKCT